MYPIHLPATEHLVLDNGLHVRLHHQPRLKRAAAFMRVAAGSHDVPVAWPGLAHFLEHLFFLGTERYHGDQGLMSFVQNQGGQVNASTRERCTDYFFELPVPVFTAGLERLCDMLGHPRMTRAEQLREREVLHAEFIAWSRDSQARQQLWLASALAAEHPLRAFHAGNRYSLPVPRDSFQQDLRAFYRQFYQTGQMTLCLVGPQPLTELRACAEKAALALRSGATAEQAPPPPLQGPGAEPFERPDPGRFNLVFACEQLPRGAIQALDFLATWLTANQPGGLLAELQRRQLVSGLRLDTAYAFAEQALVDIQFDLTATGQQHIDLISQLCFDWLEFFQAHDDWQGLRDEYALLKYRRLEVGTALDLARHYSDDSGVDSGALSVPALREVLQQLRPDNLLHGATAQPERELACQWRLPPRNRFLRPSRRPEHQVADPQGLTYVPGPAPHGHESAVFLRWRLNASRHQGLYRILRNSLTKLVEEASQAGVQMSFSTLGEDWLLKLSGIQAPIPALLESALEVLAIPLPEVWHQAGQEQPAPVLTPIRELLRQLPEHALGHLQSRSGDEDLRPLALQRLWGSARWDGLAVGLDENERSALNAALRRMPGTPSDTLTQPTAISPGRTWRHVPCSANEQALLVFCPAPSHDITDEACWRLLAHLCQGPFYQRLRVEQQLGYAVFSGLRQIGGRTGLLFGVQSPHASQQEVFEQVRSFVQSVASIVRDDNPAALKAQCSEFAQRYELAQMDLLPLAELLWQARMAGHGASYLNNLRQALRSLQPGHLENAAQQLGEATGGWLCLANGPAPEPAWAGLARSLPNR